MILKVEGMSQGEWFYYECSRVHKVLIPSDHGESVFEDEGGSLVICEPLKDSGEYEHVSTSFELETSDGPRFITTNKFAFLCNDQGDTIETLCFGPPENLKKKAK